MKKILTNKLVLYVTFFIALATIFRFLVSNNCAAILFFILLSLLTTYFSKNMIVILGCAIIGTNILALLNIFNNNSNNSIIENFDTEEEDDGDDGVVEGPDTDDPEETPKPKPKPNPKPKSKPASTPKPKSKSLDIEKLISSNSESNETKKTPDTKKGFDNMGANNKLNPADIIPNLNNILSSNDKALAKEKAHDLFEQTLGSDSIRNTTKDTKKLLKKQVELMDQMKEITPLISQTMGMVNNLDFNNISTMFEKLSNFLPNDSS